MLIILGIAAILLLTTFLLLSNKNPAKQHSLSSDQNSLYSWNKQEQQEILPKIASILSSLPQDQANVVAQCALTGFIENQFNYSQITELILRVHNGGELSKDVWNIISSCIVRGSAPYHPLTTYNGKRIPNLLIQHMGVNPL